MLGSVRGAAVRLFPFPEDGHSDVVEGIETALAAHALFGTPVWAALSADGLSRFQWPEGTRRVTIFADAGDAVDAGRQAVATLADGLSRADIPCEIVRLLIFANPWYGTGAGWRSPIPPLSGERSREEYWTDRDEKLTARQSTWIHLNSAADLNGKQGPLTPDQYDRPRHMTLLGDCPSGLVMR